MVGSIAIGVTPATLLIEQYSSTKNLKLNLVLICGVADWVEHFLQNVELKSYVFSLINCTRIDRSLFLGDGIPSSVFLFVIDPNT